MGIQLAFVEDSIFKGVLSVPGLLKCLAASLEKVLEVGRASH